MSSDIIIVGGGIIGLLTAREMVARGAKVTIIDQANIGTESSWAGGGILSPLYPWTYANAVNDLAAWGQKQYPLLAQTLLQDTGVDIQWYPCGMAMLDGGNREVAQTWAEHYHMDLHTPDQDQLHQLLPNLAAEYPDSLWLPDIANVRNPRLLQAVKQDLDRHGVVFILEEKVTDFSREQNRIDGVITNERCLNADKTVICAGAWTGELAKIIGLNLPIKPVNGQMILLDARVDVVPSIILHQGRYIIPRKDGKILVGSTLEDTGFEKNQTQDAAQELYQFARDLVPALADFPVIKHWAGLRPGTPHGIPVIGPHPQLDNLYFNAGHFRNGVVLAPASARLAADLLTGASPIVDPGPYQATTLTNQ